MRHTRAPADSAVEAETICEAVPRSIAPIIRAESVFVITCVLPSVSIYGSDIAPVMRSYEEELDHDVRFITSYGEDGLGRLMAVQMKQVLFGSRNRAERGGTLARGDNGDGSIQNDQSVLRYPLPFQLR